MIQIIGNIVLDSSYHDVATLCINLFTLYKIKKSLFYATVS